MRVQSAGRLGNNLFIWSFAISDSRRHKRSVEIFSDRHHSNLGIEREMTARLLNYDGVRFTENNLVGFLLKAVDWLENHSPILHKFLCNLYGIRSEQDSNLPEAKILRGYFQTTEYILESVEIIENQLGNAIEEVSRTSSVIQNLKNKYPKYQVLHVRLGDFIGSEFGVINPISYSNLITQDLPLVICTDGTDQQIKEILKIKPDIILTPRDTTAWETLSIIGTSERFVGVNSTLSWWGAFLVGQNQKEAYLPLIWKNSNPEHSNRLVDLPTVKFYDNTFL